MRGCLLEFAGAGAGLRGRPLSGASSSGSPFDLYFLAAFFQSEDAQKTGRNASQNTVHFYLLLPMLAHGDLGRTGIATGKLPHFSNQLSQLKRRKTYRNPPTSTGIASTDTAYKMSTLSLELTERTGPAPAGSALGCYIVPIVDRKDSLGSIVWVGRLNAVGS